MCPKQLVESLEYLVSKVLATYQRKLGRRQLDPRLNLNCGDGPVGQSLGTSRAEIFVDLFLSQDSPGNGATVGKNRVRVIHLVGLV